MRKLLVLVVAFAALASFAVPAHATGVTNATVIQTNADDPPTATLPAFPCAVGDIPCAVASLGGKVDIVDEVGSLSGTWSVSLGADGIDYFEASCLSGFATGLGAALRLTKGVTTIDFNLAYIRAAAAAVVVLLPVGATGASGLAVIFTPKSETVDVFLESRCTGGTSPGSLTVEFLGGGAGAVVVA